jgi:hypothetical protein
MSPAPRHLLAAVAGVLAGVGGFALLLRLGLLLYERLWSGTPVALPVLVALFGAVGLYAGWLLGVMVFSAVRGVTEDGPAA